jgi:hypothetical protein
MRHFESDAEAVEVRSPAPEWVWSIRGAVFPGKGVDGGHRDLLKLTDEQIERAVVRYAERGVNFLQCAGFHPRFMYLDVLEEITDLNRRITEAAHRHGLRTWDHHTSTGLWTAIEGTYKGWDPNSAVCVDIRTGQPYPKDETRFLCVNNPEYQRHYDEYVLDLIARTGVDGLMYDDIIFFRGQYGCGCEHCRRKFRELFGYDLPAPGEWPLDDYTSPLWRDWIRFRIRSTRDRVEQLRPKLPEDFAFFTCACVGVLGLEDMHHAGTSYEKHGVNVLFVEGGALAYRDKPTWDRNFFAHWERLYVEKKYNRGVGASYHLAPFELHYPAQPDDGWFCWALTKMTGGNLWRCDANTYGGMKYADEFEQWQPQYDYFNWEASHEDLWRFVRPLAEVGLLFSAATKRNVGPDPQPHGEEFAGWAQSLQRARIPFDAVVDRDLEDLDRLARLRVLILPNAICLSDRQLDVIRAFVEAGGCVIATHQTSLCDETGKPREDFGLADLLGVHHNSGQVMQRASWTLDRRWRAEPLAADLPPWLPFAPAISLGFDGETAERKVLGWIERTMPTFDWPTMPAVVESRLGKGRAVYLAPQVGALAYREGPFPIWHHEPQHDYPEPGSTSQSDPARGSLTPASGAWLQVDKGSEAYRTLVANLLRHVLPQPRIELLGLPAGVLCEQYRLAPAPDDTGHEGDWVISLLNLQGAAAGDGRWLPKTAQPNYPRLKGTARIVLRDACCKNATLFGPDLREPSTLHVQCNTETFEVTLPLDRIRRLGLVRIGRT